MKITLDTDTGHVILDAVLEDVLANIDALTDASYALIQVAAQMKIGQDAIDAEQAIMPELSKMNGAPVSELIVMHAYAKEQLARATELHGMEGAPPIADGMAMMWQDVVDDLEAEIKASV